mmetsp:Transcript_5395/g.5557  ORF Transcript_5395/g.5557 Transcript_5395/m.5557 type:complete len:86 (+) Transcript_5395:496-753(+)|eukprot:CAMPEP_0182439546 /NCGR_PEP_ID=MMETSP1167-20130531/86507_1 /TAXON_ID=2988 /ORGANISM="Mallomonas Sp, Strain CCMP3275" /LENGTH=85 /DNA_ID=CAMNT_0024633279 /DNA_START=422 /DNA_END=679 /DNA_ORIENTATION=+
MSHHRFSRSDMSAGSVHLSGGSEGGLLRHAPSECSKYLERELKGRNITPDKLWEQNRTRRAYLTSQQSDSADKTSEFLYPTLSPV